MKKRTIRAYVAFKNGVDPSRVTMRMAMDTIGIQSHAFIRRYIDDVDFMVYEDDAGNIRFDYFISVFKKKKL